MNDHEQLMSKLAELDAPLPPDWTVPLSIMASILLLLPIAFIMLSLHLNKMHARSQLTIRQLALIQLDQLEASWAAQQCDQRHAAYQLATLLRLGLSLKQLDHSPYQNDPHWHRLTLTLKALRYTKDAKQPDSEHLLNAETFQAARHWLSNTNIPQAQPC